MWRRAVLPHVQALPGAEREPAVFDRDADRGLRENAPDVRGHVVIALGVVREDAVTVGYEPRRERF